MTFSCPSQHHICLRARPSSPDPAERVNSGLVQTFRTSTEKSAIWYDSNVALWAGQYLQRVASGYWLKMQKSPASQGDRAISCGLDAIFCQSRLRRPRDVERTSFFTDRPTRCRCRNVLVRCTMAFQSDVAKWNSPTRGVSEPRQWKRNFLK